VAGQRTGDEFQLRVPGLAGIGQVAAHRNGRGDAHQRAQHSVVVGEQFVQARDHRQRRRRIDPRQLCRIERIALLEARDIGRAQALDQRLALGHVQIAEVAQHDAVGALLALAQRFEHIAAMAGGDVQHAHRRALPAQALGSVAQQFLQVLATHADTTPADRIQVVAVDHPPQRALAACFVAVDVIQRATRIETGLQTQRDAFGQPATEAQATAHHAPAQVGQAVALRRPGQDLGLFEGRPVAVRIAP
jgi:hypothetical protein